MYDVVIGNIPKARDPGDPDLSWETACAVTRVQANKGCSIPPSTVSHAKKFSTFS